VTRRRAKILQMLDRLEAHEQRFLQQHFLAPVVRGQGVRVRIGGVVCTMRIDPNDFSGWGVFLPMSFVDAMLDRPATMGERRRYLEMLPAVRMIVCRRDFGLTFAVPANPGDSRCRTDGMLVIQLCEQVELFESLVARFDGLQFWFEQSDESADPAAAAYLRQMLAKMTPPKDLDRRGLTAGQRNAYAMHYASRREAIELNQRQRHERRLTDALAHAGAQLRDFAEAHGQYRVTFDFDGQRHTSMIGRDLTVRSAGICLSGLDATFDLNSLVGVLREGRGRGRVY
jgi:hypothetical protein